MAFTNGIDKNGDNVNTAGITMFSIIDKTFPKTTLQLWNYYAHDIVNFVNIQGDKIFSLNEIDITLKLQYLKENDIGDSLHGNVDASMYGVIGMFNIAPFTISLAYNHSDGEFFNPWGFDSGFTSSMFSKNEYRDNVSAYKFGTKYSYSKDIKLSISYANYGQSNSYGGNINRSLYPFHAHFYVFFKDTISNFLAYILSSNKHLIENDYQYY